MTEDSFHVVGSIQLTVHNTHHSRFVLGRLRSFLYLVPRPLVVEVFYSYFWDCCFWDYLMAAISVSANCLLVFVVVYVVEVFLTAVPMEESQVVVWFVALVVVMMVVSAVLDSSLLGPNFPC